jgi:hypothetical protein
MVSITNILISNDFRARRPTNAYTWPIVREWQILDAGRCGWLASCISYNRRNGRQPWWISLSRGRHSSESWGQERRFYALLKEQIVSSERGGSFYIHHKIWSEIIQDSSNNVRIQDFVVLGQI